MFYSALIIIMIKHAISKFGPIFDREREPWTTAWSGQLHSKYRIFRFDGEQYQSVSDSIVSHRQTYGLANYKGQALTVGCDRNEDSNFNGAEKCSFKTEILNMSKLVWSDRLPNRHHGEKYPNYPFRSKLVKILPSLA